VLLYPRPVLLKAPAQFVRGFCMGAADIVPGVSGGTVALVFGIYAHLVAAIKQGAVALGRFVRLDLRGGFEELKQVDWAFLLPLLAGIGVAVVTLAHLIETLLEEQPVRMAAVFFGLVLASIVVAWSYVGRRDARTAALLVAVAVLTFVVLGLRSGPVEDPALWAVFLAGAIAICAMILPGVSGSFLLLMLGMYESVLGAVSDRDLTIAVVFGLGCILGLALFSSLLDWALEHHHDLVMAGLVGLMAGSLRVLWPWPEGTAATELAAPSGDVVVPVVLAAVAFAVVIVVATLGTRRADRNETVALSR
jgi:putative membrane protein